MAVFRAYRLVPPAIIAEKVSKPAGRWIECVHEERQYNGQENPQP